MRERRKGEWRIDGERERGGSLWRREKEKERQRERERRVAGGEKERKIRRSKC